MFWAHQDHIFDKTVMENGSGQTKKKPTCTLVTVGNEDARLLQLFPGPCGEHPHTF